jgi:hypothetical protein
VTSRRKRYVKKEIRDDKKEKGLKDEKFPVKHKRVLSITIKNLT